MGFYNKYLITVIAAFICFLLEVEDANTTPELTSEQLKECIKWEELNSGYCIPGTYKCETFQGSCCKCPEGSFMKWFNTCPMCIRFLVCDVRDVVSYPGDTKNDRICAGSPPTTGGGWFGSFKTDLADEFDGDAVGQMVTYFNLPPKKKKQVEQANNKGLELLSVLEDSGTIGEEKGIDKLCEALEICKLNRLSHKATELFNHPSKDIPDGPVETILTLHDVKELLSAELTVQDCYEIAIFLGLQARYVQEIKKSQNSAVDLIDKINDGKDNSDSTINALLFALQKRGKIRVANWILNSEGLPSSIKARASSKENILPACVCGQNSYKELKSHSDGSVVSLQCNSCAAEWFPTTESSTEASLEWKGKKFSYKIPRELDLSELKHEQVEDVNELQHGDHIVFRRLWVIYDHHAIFLHKSEKEKGKIKVIHWTGPPTRIECEDVWFPTGGVRRVQYPKSDPADVVVARAYDLLSNSSQVYDLANNNCESLATFCKIGKAFSIQGKVVGDVLPLLPKVLNKCFKNLPDLSLGAQSLNQYQGSVSSGRNLFLLGTWKKQGETCFFQVSSSFFRKKLEETGRNLKKLCKLAYKQHSHTLSYIKRQIVYHHSNH